MILCCSLALAFSAADAALLGYWNFNGSYDRTGGTMGSLSAELEAFGLDYQDLNGEGSAINLVPPSLADTSLRFFSLASIAEVGHVAIVGLNFVNYASPTISFAAQNSPAFQVGDEFYVEYDLGLGGGWVKAADLAAPDTPFQLITYTFAPGLLDGKSNVGIRLTFSTALNFIDTLEFDNLQITAVPEPGSLVLVALGLSGLALWRRKTAGA